MYSLRSPGKGLPMQRTVITICGLVVLTLAIAGVGPAKLGAQDRVFELRTYTAHEARLDDVVRRFEDHTMRLLEVHGMENIGYWIPQDPALSANTLIYLLAHESREGATASWSAFFADPQWHAVRDASEANGPIVQGVVRVFLDPTQGSPLR